ncbi:UNKNOWN [Stylonychia lemnae]|uniref:Uncharacterized protein n=1 Tax=Stylonychia lemnae TaxID=5949 RepID=A0A078AMF1_STYLE|nr:UNKNOWN [Stylonychia lemnae]|eukprot:CDW83091.1 UNKNOWN [Stylonychia lemnae]
MRDYKDVGLEVQKDPYFYLLSEADKQRSRNIPFRMLFDLGAIGGSAVYFLTRHNQLNSVKTLSISLNLVFGLTWRVLFAAVISDQISRRLFVNSYKLKQNQMANYECRKIMVQWPNAKQLPAPHQKQVSTFLV